MQTEDLVEHLEHLLELLLPLREQLEKYLSREDVDVAVAVWWEPSDGPVGFTVPARLLHGLAELCDEFDFYFA